MKIPAKRIPMDDCAVYVGRRIAGGKIVELGTAHFVHKGEWIDIVPVQTVEQHLALVSLLTMSPEVDEKASPEERAKCLEQLTARLTEQFDGLMRTISERVVDWNLTDLHEEPLPKPYRSPAAIKKLTTDELYFIANVLSEGEAPAERKNGSVPSLITSSAEGPGQPKPLSV